MKLFLCAFLPTAAYACVALGGSQNFCGANVHVAFDATAYMGTPERVHQVFEYIFNIYLPNFRAGPTMFDVNFYGGNNTAWIQHFENTKDGLCDALAYVKENLPSTSTQMNIVTLAQLLPSMCNGAHEIVLFTATTDQADIKQASQLTNQWTFQNNITIIHIGADNNNVDFSSWRNTQVICTKLPFESSLLNRIVGVQCNPNMAGKACFERTTQPSTTTPQYSTMKQTNAAPTGDTDSSQCPCDLTKVWNDVFVLFDGSTGLHTAKFDEMTDFVISSFASLPIGQALQFNTRVGIAVYGTNVSNIAPLSKYQSFYDMLKEEFRQMKDPYTNVKAAIDNAREHFELSEHRGNARKVILIAASTYRDGPYEDPLIMAETFKKNGGVIIVVEYGDVNGKTSVVLKQVASPGYYVDATTSTPDVNAFTNLQCKANCFCPENYKAVSSSAAGEPIDGCFFVSDLQSIQPLANRQCSRMTNGKLAMPRDTHQKVTLLQDKAPVWVGLQKVGGAWQWADGAACTENVVSTGTGDCAYLQRQNGGFATRFVEADCNTSYKFGCQTTPCSSTNMCI